MRAGLTLFALLLLTAPAAVAQQADEPPGAYGSAGIMSFPSPEVPRGDGVGQPPTAPEMTPEPPAEQVVAGLSSDAVEITTSFDGSEIIIYGAIKRESPIPQNSKLDIVATIEGPPRSVTIRRKSRRFGIWVNTDSVVVGATPSFYSVATTDLLSEVLLPETDAAYRISIPMAMRAFARPVNVENPADFTEAMIAARIADGSYRLDQGASRWPTIRCSAPISACPPT